jgi:putative ABC transport system permease protein
MPEGFAFPDPETQAWVPLALDREQPWGRNNHYLRVIARLDAGMDIGTAAAQLDQLGARDTEIFPDFYAERVSFRAYPLHERMVGDVRTVLLLLMGGVAGVLLIGAVNAASLFLARAERRRGEIAVRTALGAGRARISAQLFFESAFVSLLAVLRDDRAAPGLRQLGADPARGSDRQPVVGARPFCCCPSPPEQVERNRPSVSEFPARGGDAPKAPTRPSRP